MSYVNTLIREVRESRDLTLKTVEHFTRYSSSAINRWELGCGMVPADYLSRLYDITKDFRLVQLIAPGLSVLEHAPAATPPAPLRTPPPGDLRELNPKAIDAIEQTVKCARYIQRILDDGVVSDSDESAMAQYEEHANCAGHLLAAISRTLAQLRKESKT